jgi:serine/threonine-protein kinase HipA
MIEELQAWTNERLMGRVHWDRRRDRLSFSYEEAWRGDATAFPLSLSMPMSAVEHGHAMVSTYLWGLLPDNDGVLRRWGERFQVSPGNPFRLLSHVGEDCAGAVQLVKPTRADEWAGAASAGRVKWLDEKDLAERIRVLLLDHSATRSGADRGQFSLAGAQPKTALHYDPKKDRWGVPSGRVPTTHIFKPATGDFDGYMENEHFCMALARALGLAAASSIIRVFDDVPVIIVERFDRTRHGSQVLRIHQEDMCQALARMPQQKYQNHGGPSAVEILRVIRQHSSAREQDEARFLDALIFNWLICGTDAHAKNYALLMAAQSRVRLAPLYDVSSAMPYFPRQVDPRRATLAMKIGGKYRLREIGMREWKKCAAELRCDADALRHRIASMAAAMPAAAESVQKEMRSQGIRHAVTQRLVTALRERAAECDALLSA